MADFSDASPRTSSKSSKSRCQELDLNPVRYEEQCFRKQNYLNKTHAVSAFCTWPEIDLKLGKPIL